MKSTLNDESLLLNFLRLNRNKIKITLVYINSETEKCKGDDTKEKIFKDAIKAYFYAIKNGQHNIFESNLDEFKEQITSGC
ncbi:hypothetical protein F9Y90_04805 (plasmid) [Borrelia miyamotoi]|uniref:Uncharacterized protein n=1 Tax=Borrelia miyamotoi TaxID=47466 RepID=A0A5P8ARJ2_9SPIR|nr:Mlp family lipoprotein [Borrelia miyamotoi]QFP42433.1 hypothetical protein F9Y90_04805 [Borrelia miyamotoi]WAZ72311.1 hypothetical protein O5404_04650 [Borrelia miyamotoi]